MKQDFAKPVPCWSGPWRLIPRAPSCHAWLAHWYLFLVGQGWATDIALAAERADSLSQQAVILDPGDARGFAVAGHVRAFLHKDAEAALWLHERAIDLNPNLAIAWCYSGLAHSYLGQHSEAIRRIEHAQRLSPFDPHSYFFDMALGMAFLLIGQYEAAARVGRRARDLNPGFSSTYRALLAALGSPWCTPGGCFGPQGTDGVGAWLLDRRCSRAVTLSEAGRSGPVRGGVAPGRDTRAIQTLRSIGRDGRGCHGAAVLPLNGHSLWRRFLAATA